MTPATPQTNFLAVTGLAADPRGKLVTPARGPLDLSWLFHVPPETVRRARERLAQGNVTLDRETLAGWFCLCAPHDQMALEHLEQRAWRKALRIWRSKEGERWAIHNRATLHRLMYQCEESGNRGGHLRKAVELYHRLIREHPAYQGLAEWGAAELKLALREAHKTRDDEMVAKSLLLVAEALGMPACEELQEELMLAEMDDLALLCATLTRELLPYQGVVHLPPRNLLQSAQETAELDVLPAAVRLAFRLVPGSRQRRKVDAQVAELCGLLAQTLSKAGEGQAGKKWQGEAQRWEPKVAQVWNEPEDDSFGDETAARVEFSQTGLESAPEEPRQWGLAWLGVSARPALVKQHDAREEWIEAVRLLGIPLFPLRRFVMYRNLDTGEVSNGKRLPLKTGHYLWQTAIVVLLSLGLIAGGLRGYAAFSKGQPDRGAPVLSAEQRQAEIARAINRLKRLAEAEAELRKKPGSDRKRLEAMEAERQALIEKVERLEQGG